MVDIKGENRIDLTADIFCCIQSTDVFTGNKT